MSNCPLCHGANLSPYHSDRKRSYLQCGNCRLVIADPASRLTPEQEKAVYDQHENCPDDPGYQTFLSRLAAPLVEKLRQENLAGVSGLDFGCGPGPALCQMLTQAGFPTVGYDPYYAPNTQLLDTQYDFVTCTEAIEHFYTPAKEWQLLMSLVKPGGWLAIMTKLVRSPEAFAGWHYKNDPTHVSFFSRETFGFLAERDGLQLEFAADDVMLLKKVQA
ncbi:class I SAM-dependent methyltransferase [Parasalinivibrio latis]|uniref:class I SAM-dependent methyltransferase n=1 Tax=Parasalinivibrio latis TaxID=2952610 RepID=UPI0030DDFB87